jgi:DNA-binding response OmpR family regulator
VLGGVVQVVIVDDDAAETHLIAAAVRGLPKVVPLRFTSPARALAWAATNEPALVVVDYHMPEMDGLEFMQSLRALPGKAETPVVLVTADADLSIRLRALEMGVDDFVIKPYRTVEIRERIWNILDERRLREMRANQDAFMMAQAFDDRSHLDYEVEAAG